MRSFASVLFILAAALASTPAATAAEVGANDFLVSDMSGIGRPCAFCAFDAAVAYNALRNEYLVVWSGFEGGAEGFEIYGQRLDAATGAELGENDFQVSQMGGPESRLAEAFLPALVWNPLRDQYLVVWSGDDGRGGFADGEFEIWGQRLAYAAGGGLVELSGDFRLSEMGATGAADFDAASPAVAHNPAADEYLVVWSAEDDEHGLVDGEVEVYGQRLAHDAGGALGEVGADDFRVSEMGGTGDPLFDAFDPALAFNPAEEEYLVVWVGDDSAAGLAEGEFEIFGQRLDGSGLPLGTDDFRLSSLGPAADPEFDAASPAVVYNPDRDEVLVAWDGDDDEGGLVDDETEIFAQRLAYDGAGGLVAVGGRLRVSDAGGTGDPAFDARRPALAYDGAAGEYLVAWDGDDNEQGRIDGEFEISAQRLDAATGAEVGDDDFRVSDMGGTGGVGFEGRFPAVAQARRRDEYLVVWEGDDDQGGLVNADHEIFAQRLQFALFADGFETGDLSRWSLVVP
jgi:hypothetical protein